MNKALIKQFLSQHQICVVSTTNDQGTPEAAVVGFSETDELELVIATSNLSRKYQNIVKRPNVALVVGWDERITVQYEGTAHVLDRVEMTKYQKSHFAKLPIAERYKDQPHEAYIVIRPNWLRYSDCTTWPWTVTEFSF